MPTSRRRRAVLAVVVALSALAAGCSDDGDGAATTTVAPTTLPADETTTTGEPGTTSTSEPVADIVLRGDGLGVADLGASPTDAVAAVVEVLGEPTKDTGWEQSSGSYGTCPGGQIRGVEWDHLVLLFTDGDTEYGSDEHFFSWRLTGSPPALGTASGFGYQATAADAEELYPGRVETVPAEEPFPAFLEIDAEGGLITAYLDNDEIVTNLEAGAPCGE